MVSPVNKELWRAREVAERSLKQGFSLLMFGATIWTLLSHQSNEQANRKMLTVACALLVCSTAVCVSFPCNC